MGRDDLIRAQFTPGGLGLEVGPSYGPLFPKSAGYAVETIDYTDQAGLQRKYAANPSVDCSRIEPVDYVQRAPDARGDRQAPARCLDFRVGQIVPLPQTSQIGLRIVQEVGLRPELIYIDASHDYNDVKQDLAVAWECVAENGVIFGDDYLGWPGVTRAVDEFCISHNLIVIGGNGKFAFARQGNILDLLGKKNLVRPDGSCGGLKVCRPSV